MRISRRLGLGAAVAVSVLAGPASANESGWLSNALLEIVDAKAADKLDALAPGTIRLKAEASASWQPTSASKAIDAVAGCRVVYAQDTTRTRGRPNEQLPWTAAIIAFACPDRGPVPGSPCKDLGFSLVARPIAGGRYEIDVSRRDIWSDTRCGPQKPSALAPR